MFSGFELKKKRLVHYRIKLVGDYYTFPNLLALICQRAGETRSLAKCCTLNANYWFMLVICSEYSTDLSAQEVRHWTEREQKREGFRMKRMLRLIYTDRSCVICQNCVVGDVVIVVMVVERCKCQQGLSVHPHESLGNQHTKNSPELPMCGVWHQFWGNAVCMERRPVPSDAGRRWMRDLSTENYVQSYPDGAVVMLHVSCRVLVLVLCVTRALSFCAGYIYDNYMYTVCESGARILGVVVVVVGCNTHHHWRAIRKRAHKVLHVYTPNASGECSTQQTTRTKQCAERHQSDSCSLCKQCRTIADVTNKLARHIKNRFN